VFRIHTHIGSGSDPEVWQRVATLSLDLVRQFPEVTVLNLGGGYKVRRWGGRGRRRDWLAVNLFIFVSVVCNHN
jgi:diaminopimelate decarboxylase